MVESILSASTIGISYSNSACAIPIRGPLMAIVAMSSPTIRTRTLRSLNAAIKPSRSLTLRTANCLHASLATKNLRSISTGPLSNSNFSRTDIHGLRGWRVGRLERSLVGAPFIAHSQNFCSFLNRPSATCYCSIEIPHMIGIRTIFDLGKTYERLGIVVFDIRVDTRRYLPWCIAARCIARTVRLGTGLIGTIAALVLGLLIAAAKSSFDTQSTQV